MPKKAPAEIGMPLWKIDTPSLILDLDKLESNLDVMAENAANLGVKLRPHAKMHKSADIGQKQISRGAVGLCCQKVSEAEALIDGGIEDILVTNQVVGTNKLKRFAELANRAKIAICVDDSKNIAEINRCAEEQGVQISIFVEVNVGGDRCGVLPGEPVLDLVKDILDASSLSFGGLHAYQGKIQHIRSFEERKSAIDDVCQRVDTTIQLLNSKGISCPTVTGGGTGTWEFEGSSGVFSELQVGSYAFMDADYGRNENIDGKQTSLFEHSLFVYTTVMSVSQKNLVVVDAGLKSLAFDCGMPLVADDDTVNYHRPSDEHGVLDLSNSNRKYELGEKVRLIPGHCDPTVNLHDWYVGLRGEVVEAIWKVTARGAVF
ncbi:MAG: alanine racemase [Acidiferrobacteraceae bacterium]|nr:alanine racemase [Acidiferrobacteraceae bacterium]|tara:strand:- start:651 stop:1775 length:1125 start_codon:yes stop_codon:yes gene_type:complete